MEGMSTLFATLRALLHKAPAAVLGYLPAGYLAGVLLALAVVFWVLWAAWEGCVEAWCGWGRSGGRVLPVAGGQPQVTAPLHPGPFVAATGPKFMAGNLSHHREPLLSSRPRAAHTMHAAHPAREAAAGAALAMGLTLMPNVASVRAEPVAVVQEAEGLTPAERKEAFKARMQAEMAAKAKAKEEAALAANAEAEAGAQAAKEQRIEQARLEAEKKQELARLAKDPAYQEEQKRLKAEQKEIEAREAVERKEAELQAKADEASREREEAERKKEEAVQAKIDKAAKARAEKEARDQAAAERAAGAQSAVNDVFNKAKVQAQQAQEAATQKEAEAAAKKEADALQSFIERSQEAVKKQEAAEAAAQAKADALSKAAADTQAKKEAAAQAKVDAAAKREADIQEQKEQARLAKDPAFQEEQRRIKLEKEVQKQEAQHAKEEAKYQALKETADAKEAALRAKTEKSLEAKAQAAAKKAEAEAKVQARLKAAKEAKQVQSSKLKTESEAFNALKTADIPAVPPPPVIVYDPPPVEEVVATTKVEKQAAAKTATTEAQSDATSAAPSGAKAPVTPPAAAPVPTPPQEQPMDIPAALEGFERKYPNKQPLLGSRAAGLRGAGFDKKPSPGMARDRGPLLGTWRLDTPAQRQAAVKERAQQRRLFDLIDPAPPKVVRPEKPREKPVDRPLGQVGDKAKPGAGMKRKEEEMGFKPFKGQAGREWFQTQKPATPPSAPKTDDVSKNEYIQGLLKKTEENKKINEEKVKGQRINWPQDIPPRPRAGEKVAGKTYDTGVPKNETLYMYGPGYNATVRSMQKKLEPSVAPAAQTMGEPVALPTRPDFLGPAAAPQARSDKPQRPRWLPAPKSPEAFPPSSRGTDPATREAKRQAIKERDDAQRQQSLDAMLTKAEAKAQAKQEAQIQAAAELEKRTAALNEKKAAEAARRAAEPMPQRPTWLPPADEAGRARQSKTAEERAAARAEREQQYAADLAAKKEAITLRQQQNPTKMPERPKWLQKRDAYSEGLRNKEYSMPTRPGFLPAVDAEGKARIAQEKADKLAAKQQAKEDYAAELTAKKQQAKQRQLDNDEKMRNPVKPKRPSFLGPAKASKKEAPSADGKPSRPSYLPQPKGERDFPNRYSGKAGWMGKGSGGNGMAGEIPVEAGQ